MNWRRNPPSESMKLEAARLRALGSLVLRTLGRLCKLRNGLLRWRMRGVKLRKPRRNIVRVCARGVHVRRRRSGCTRRGVPKAKQEDEVKSIREILGEIRLGRRLDSPTFRPRISPSRHLSYAVPDWHGESDA
jgi:hypothetical protein